MSNQNKHSALSNFALWISITASSIIIFAFFTGITSLQEGLDFISKTVSPPTLINGSPENLLPSSDHVPDELIKAQDQSLSNEEIAKRYDNPIEVFNNLELWGRGLNFRQKYLHKDGCNSKAGLREVAFQAIIHETVFGATQYLDWLKTNETARRHSTRVVSTDAVGENAFIFWYDSTSDCAPPDEVLYVAIAFQRYNALCIVEVGAVKGTMSEDDMQSLAIRLAKLIDLRLVAEAK